MESYEKACNAIQPGLPWSTLLLAEHKVLLKILDDKPSRANQLEQIIDQAMFIQSSYSRNSVILFSGAVWYFFNLIRASTGSEHRREGELVRYIGKEVKKLFFRILVGVIGGLAIIVPMLIMSFNPSKTKNLVTTSVCVFYFAVFLGFSRSQSNAQLVAGTAAYAAVLVVFVGTSGQ
jgi:hypothetical protein